MTFILNFKIKASKTIPSMCAVAWGFREEWKNKVKRPTCKQE